MISNSKNGFEISLQFLEGGIIIIIGQPSLAWWVCLYPSRAGDTQRDRQSKEMAFREMELSWLNILESLPSEGNESDDGNRK